MYFYIVKIQILILSFRIDLIRYMKQLIEAGYIYIAQPPLFRISKNKKGYYLYNESKVKTLLEKIGKDGTNLQRYKGLGEMNPIQLWDTTMNPNNRILLKITLEDAVEADKIFTILMGDQVEPRREFIRKHAKEVINLDV